MSSAENLRQMLNNTGSQSDNLASSISQVQDQIDDLTNQIDGVQNGLCTVAQADLVAYLDGTKIPELEILYDSTGTVEYGANFGTINYTTGGITDWQIVDSTGGVIYKYLGTNWDSDSMITKWITDYAFGNDYLTRPLTTGATYGIIPAKTNLETAKAILEENKDKIDNSATTFADYAT
jgi:hypothetical protein